MIKRQFYKQERGDRDDDSDSDSDESSSSSDSEVEAEAEATEKEVSEEETKTVSDVEAESESSSDSSGSLSSDRSDDDAEFGAAKQNTKYGWLTNKRSAEVWKTQSNIMQKDDSLPADFASYILKCKSVFKCKLCPRVVCLTEETLKTHLKSKGHARSEKLLKEGKLKLMLNSDGEIEEEPETHAERHARIVALTQDAAKPGMKNKGRQRQKQRLKRKRAALESVAVAERGSKKKNKK